MNLRKSMYINELNHLEISGCDATDLVKKFGTPLYVMDVEYIKDVVESFKAAIKNDYNDNGNIAFASKAFSTKAIYALMKKLNTNIDVVSKGEMYTAVSAGFPLENAYFHGNNKLIEELEYAMENKIGTIVIDNLIDIERIQKIAEKLNIVQKVLIRINPGVEAHTHEFVQTSKTDSKFGFSVDSGDAFNAIVEILKHNNIYFAGLHSHIGSQIFDNKGFKEQVKKVISFTKKLNNELNVQIHELNFGGGFGVHYTSKDPMFSVDDYTKNIKIIINELKNELKSNNIQNNPRIMFEPGRSIVGEAGITLYSVGSIKDIKDIKKYINIDGGMTDNIRPALYGAKYEAVLANRVNDKNTEIVSIAGKCCESGDIILKNVEMPIAKIGDIVAVFTTGAYNYSMSNNYNRNLIPPVVFVEKGKSDYAVAPQTYEDLIRNDIIPDWIND